MLGTSADHEEHGRLESELNLRAQTSTGRLAHRKRPLASCMKQLSGGEMVALLKVHRAGCKQPDDTNAGCSASSWRSELAPGPAAMCRRSRGQPSLRHKQQGTSSNSAPAAAESWEQQRCRETRRGPHVVGHRASVSVCDVCCVWHAGCGVASARAWSTQVSTTNEYSRGRGGHPVRWTFSTHAHVTTDIPMCCPE